MNKIALLLLVSISINLCAQQGKKLKVLNADVTYTDKKYPNATISDGNVSVEIDGAHLECDRVIMYSKDNYLKAMGNVVVNQGDTVFQTSQFADYDGNKKLATSWGNVVLKDPTMTLSTQKLKFDRENQILYYKSNGTIEDETNVLNSKVGNYYLESNQFEAFTNVTVVNPDQTLDTNHLEYNTDSGKAYLYGPSTIIGDDSEVYTEKGYHDSKTRISHLTKNSWIQYENKLIEGDSLYYNEPQNYSSGTGNIKMTDTLNNSVLKGGYGEFYRSIDSAYIIIRAEAISLVENDSLHIHGDTLLITGKPDARIIRAFHHVKFFKPDFTGKCDSLVSIESEGLTKMYRKPVLWAQGSQITGDIIHFLSNKETEQIDSLKVLGNAFMIQLDSAGYNQTKGRIILGKFEDNDLKTIDVNGNSEVIQYVRNDEDELIGINKSRSSKIHLTMENQQLNTIDLIGDPDGKIYPEEKIHKNDRKLKGFEWRASERPLSKHDIFTHDPGDDAIIRQVRIKEREDKIEAQKEEVRKRKRELLKLEEQRKTDSIEKSIPEKIPLKPVKG